MIYYYIIISFNYTLSGKEGECTLKEKEFFKTLHDASLT